MSWIISKALLESLPSLPGQEEESLGGISLDGAPCVLWNGKHTQLPSWCSDKTMANCQLSQSGMTFKPLTDDLGEAVLMSYLEGFPVKTSPVPEKEQASRGSDPPCGHTWRESLEKFDLDTRSWKTHQCLWDEVLQPSSVILPKWGMMRSGVLWERTTLPRLTSGTGSGSWPTAQARDYRSVTGREHEQRDNAMQNLNVAVVYNQKNWPTPTTRDYKGVPPDGYFRDGELQTDTVDRAVHAVSDGNKNGQLNPTWVEWLMGWPIGWTSMEPITELDWRDWKTDPADEGEPGTWATPKASIDGTSPKTLQMVRDGDAEKSLMRQVLMEGTNTGSIPRVATGIKHRVGRLKAIGNGQVPQVAALAWRILTQ